MREVRILICFLLVTFSSCRAWAIPKEVTIFPEVARVTEQTKVRLLPEGKDLRKAVIIIPGSADPISFTVSFTALPPLETKASIEDHTWRKLPRDEDAGIKDRRRQIKQLRDERNGLQASLHGLDNQIQFWQQQTKAKAKNIIESGVIAAAIGKNIKKAFQEKLSIGPEITRLDQKIKECEDELNLNRGKDDQPWVWEVTILLSGVLGNDILLTYSYTLTGCGWQPAYRLDARPAREEILFGQEAEIWQNSGQDWNDVVVQLTTFTAPGSLLTPAPLPSGTVKPREGVKTKVKRTADKTQALSGSAALNEISTRPTADDNMLWSAGKKTILAGSRQKIKISEEIWPAAFSYLARPAQSRQAFISAFINFPEARKIPPGQTTFFYQGALLGKSNFSISGKQEFIFFGQAPQVTVTRQLQTDQTRHRQWRLEARNGLATPIKLRIEESAPQAQDSRIKVKLLAAGAEEKPGQLSWELGLAAGEIKTIIYGIDFEAPTGMEIDSGPSQ